MKESDFIKSVTDRQLPDLEAVKKACVEQKPQKNKILALKPSRLIAVAVISTIILTGMVATFASQGGGLFSFINKEQPTTSSSASKPAKKNKKTATTSVTSPSSSNQIAINPTTSSKQKKKKAKKIESTKQPDDLFDSFLSENGIEATEKIYLGEIGDYAIYFADTQIAGNYTCDYIMGSRTISASAQRQSYGLSIYAVSEGLSCTLSDAYDMRIFDDFDKVARLISENDRLSGFGISVSDNNAAHQMLSEEFGTARTSELVPLGSTDAYTLYYRVNGTCTEEYGYKLFIEDMVFDMTDTQKRYAPGLYVVSSDGVYTMTQAINDGIAADSNELATIIEQASADIPFIWTFSRAPQPENEATTEE